MIKLYDYPFSTASYRVRIALKFKNLPFETIPLSLINNNGEHHTESFHRVNVQEMVPALIDGDVVLNQSLAILDYLEEKYPHPTLFPTTPEKRAYVRAIALMIACDMHPLNNLRVLVYLREKLKVSEEQKLEWYHNWLRLGFQALEEKISKSGFAGKYCCGDQMTMADMCLIPQLFNAKRFEFDVEAYPTLRAINEVCLAHEFVSSVTPSLTR